MKTKLYRDSSSLDLAIKCIEDKGRCPKIKLDFAATCEGCPFDSFCSAESASEDWGSLIQMQRRDNGRLSIAHKLLRIEKMKKVLIYA